MSGVVVERKSGRCGGEGGEDGEGASMEEGCPVTGGERSLPGRSISSATTDPCRGDASARVEETASESSPQVELTVGREGGGAKPPAADGSVVGGAEWGCGSVGQAKFHSPPKTIFKPTVDVRDRTENSWQHARTYV